MKKRQITKVKFNISYPGHGGGAYYCDLDLVGDKYKIRLSSSSVIEPRPGDRLSKPIFLEKSPQLEISKTNQEIETFLETILETFDVFNLPNSETKYAFLHPVFYTFYFQDSDGTEHSFKYTTEGSTHRNQTYESLVNACNAFFEIDRIYQLAREVREAAIQDYRKKQYPWWKFWKLDRYF